MQTRAEPKPRDLMQAKVEKLRELATTGVGAEAHDTLIALLRVAEGEAKDRLVEADPEVFQLIQGEAQAYKRLLKVLTQPKRLIQGKLNV